MAEFKLFTEDVKRPFNPITDLYDFWQKRVNYRYLKIVGKRLAACPASSANTERIFSTLNQIFGARRNQLSLQTIFDLATINLEERISKSKSRFKHLPAAQELSVDVLCNDDIGGFTNEIYLLEENPELSDELPPFEAFEDTFYNLMTAFDRIIDYDMYEPEPLPEADHEGGVAKELESY